MSVIGLNITAGPKYKSNKNTEIEDQNQDEDDFDVSAIGNHHAEQRARQEKVEEQKKAYGTDHNIFNVSKVSSYGEVNVKSNFNSASSEF